MIIRLMEKGDKLT
jgi:hypothetical protein